MKLSALPVVATAILTLPAHAQPDPIARPLPAASGTEAVGRLLHELGYAPKALSPDVYQVTVERERWPVHVMLSLSTDGRRVWLESKFAPIEDPDKVPPQAWRRLLEANEKIGPAHFAFEKGDRRLHLYKSFDSIGLSATRLKAELEHFDQTVRRTKDYWRADNFKPVIASSDAAVEPGRAAVPTAKSGGDAAGPGSAEHPPRRGSFVPPNVQQLQGDWSVKEILVKGRSTPDDVMRQRRPTVNVFVGTRGYKTSAGETELSVRVTADLRLGAGRSRTVDVKFPPPVIIPAPGEPVSGPIDFVEDDDRLEQGIYKFDGDTLTLCFAAAGEPRPAEFISTEQSKTTLIVLKKAK